MLDKQIYDDAVRLVMESGKASTSLLQVKLRLSYLDAVRLIDQMEAAGIVGPAKGPGPRKVIRRKVSV